VKITFAGAARTVTGSKHLLETKDGLRILLDCGLYQGKESRGSRQNDQFNFDPESIDMVFLSHAHIDHSGLLPKLVKEGFSGPIYCTEPTKSLCEIMLADSAYIQMNDYAYSSKQKEETDTSEPLYTIDDVVATLDLFQPIPYNSWQEVREGVTVMLTYVGHIIGSACVNLRLIEGRKTHKIAYTGDIGRAKHQIIKGFEPFPQAEIIITESTYGDRLHEELESVEKQLLQIVLDTCVENKGKLIIPAFSLGRTQEVVFALDKLETRGKLPPIKVFVDSPLSTNATDIIKSYPDHYNKEILKYMERDSNPFGFGSLHYVREAKYSKLINTLKEPCIIISASGMVEAGRILHHVKNNIEDKRNTILMVGYCEPGSIGGQLRTGASQVKIYGREYKVNARIEVIDSYSAHGDYSEMADYLSCQQAHLIKHLFLVHGRYDVQEKYKAYLDSRGFHHIEIPSKGEVVELS